MGAHLAVVIALLLASADATHQEAVGDLLVALEKAADFFEREFRHINLDGVMGFQILNVEVKEALRRWPHTDLGNIHQIARVKQLVNRLNSIIAQAVVTLQESDPTYYRAFEPILRADFWTVPHMWNTSNPALVYPAFREVECFDEKLSDKCMTLLLGTWKDNGTPCIVTNSCRTFMTRLRCPDYSLSHQLLYFMFGAMKGCHNILQGESRESRANPTDHDYKRIFCSNMMKRNIEFENNGFPIQTRDIFIENIMLCGMAGFSDFYKSSWLRHILTWQDSDGGCFKKDEKESPHGLDRNLLGTTNSHKRVNRREKILKDGCSSHMTAVAVSMLGGYMNFYQMEQDITKRPLT
ncbi:CP089 protein, partial [Polyodon spathula]|nr:CP089 protein [Polyodon spathula]